MAVYGPCNRFWKTGFIPAVFSMTLGWAMPIHAAQLPSTIGGLGRPPVLLNTFQVYGGIGDKWRALGADKRVLGPPTSNEGPLEKGGRIQRFRGGNLVWSPATGAHALSGSIFDKWTQLGGVAFGFPVTDELPGARGGRYNDFSAGGTIYWSTPTGAHGVYGAIRTKWRAMGGDKSFLGYPRTDAVGAGNGGQMNGFDGGDIYWSPVSGAFAVYGKIREEWISTGKEAGRCGFPTGDEYGVTDQQTHQSFRRSDFTNGNIVWGINGQYAIVTCGVGSAAQPVPPRPPVPPRSVCSVSVIITNQSCLNADSTPSTILTPGGTSATGCGDGADSAKARAKLIFQQFGRLNDGDKPDPGSCTYSQQVVQQCLCN